MVKSEQKVETLDLKKIVICHICQTPHKKRPLAAGESASCVVCGAKLYRDYTGLEYKLLSFVASGFLFYVFAVTFPLVQVSFGPMQSSASLLEAIKTLFDQGYFLVAFFAFMVLVIYPALLFLSGFVAAAAMILGLCALSRRALLLFGFAARWSMLDIFFVSVIVAMVKIFEYASIEFGVAFWAMAFVVALEIYIVHEVGVEAIWERWEEKCEAGAV